MPYPEIMIHGMRQELAQLGIEDTDQVVEFARPVGVARRVEELPAGSHLALDVGPGLGEQGLENGPRRVLVAAVLRRRRGRREGLVEECHPDAFRPADRPEGRRRPRLVLEHLGEQRQPDGDDLAVAFDGGAASVIKMEVGNDDEIDVLDGEADLVEELVGGAEGVEVVAFGFILWPAAAHAGFD